MNASTMILARASIVAVGLMSLGLLPACGPTIRPDFNSAEPAARNAAIVEAARANDKSRIPDLIRMLKSDDPATRLLAAETLESITGQTMGYDAEASEAEREAAIGRWRAWDRIRASEASIR